MKFKPVKDIANRRIVVGPFAFKKNADKVNITFNDTIVQSVKGHVTIGEAEFGPGPSGESLLTVPFTINGVKFWVKATDAQGNNTLISLEDENGGIEPSMPM